MQTPCKRGIHICTAFLGICLRLGHIILIHLIICISLITIVQQHQAIFACQVDNCMLFEALKRLTALCLAETMVCLFCGAIWAVANLLLGFVDLRRQNLWPPSRLGERQQLSLSCA